MSELSIIVQGTLKNPRFLKSLEHYKEVSHGNVILSTWDCWARDVDPSWGIQTVFNQPPAYRFFNLANIGCQCITTISGCLSARTKYVIKVRSDEYRTNLWSFLGKMFMNPDKLICDNIFFRPTNYRALHCSDHVMGGKTKALYHTFRNAINFCRKHPNYDSKLPLPTHLVGLQERPNFDGLYPENLITLGYLRYKGEKLDLDRNSEIMRKHFDVVDVRDMGEFIVNCNNCLPHDNGLTTDRFREWGDGRTEFGSIRSMNEMNMSDLRGK